MLYILVLSKRQLYWKKKNQVSYKEHSLIGEDFIKYERCTFCSSFSFLSFFVMHILIKILWFRYFPLVFECNFFFFFKNPPLSIFSRLKETAFYRLTNLASARIEFCVVDFFSVYLTVFEKIRMALIFNGKVHY